MNPFSIFGEKIKKRLTKSYDEKITISKILSKFINEELSTDNLVLKDTVLSVRISGAKKHELMIKNKEALSLFKESGILITEIK